MPARNNSKHAFIINPALMMRRLISRFCLALLCTAACCHAQQRIVSINLCTDQTLFVLEDRDNIASLSHLSADSAYSPIADQIQGIHRNHAYIEEIIPLQPDLVLAGSFTNKHVVHFLRKMGVTVAQVDIPFNIDSIEQSIIDIGRLIGRPQRADAVISDMRQRRQQIQQQLQHTRRPLAVIIAPNGFTHGKNSIKGDLLELAHYENLAARIGIEGNGYIDLETLIMHQPEFIIIEDSSADKHSLSQRFLQHPALQRALPDTRRIEVHPNLWSCASPFIIKALEQLAAAHPREPL
ncbi:MAG TPA: ABC transporter substrate-binding protein [Pseudomonadales bacterium]